MSEASILKAADKAAPAHTGDEQHDASQKLVMDAGIMSQMAHPGAARTASRSENVVTEAVHSALYSGLQAPVTGLSQIADRAFGSDLADSTRFMNAPAPAKFGSADWYAQQIGSAAGMIVPFVLVARGNRALLGELGEARLGSSLAAEGGSLLKTSKGLAVAEQGLNGFVFDSVLRPSDPHSKTFLLDRARHGLVGAATFSTLTASSLALREVAGISASAGGLGNFLKRDVATGALAGVPAGLVAANSSSLLEKGKLANTRQSLEGAYSMMVIGGALSALNVMPGERSSESGGKSAEGTRTLATRLDAKQAELGDPLAPVDGRPGRGAASLLESLASPRPGSPARSRALASVDLEGGVDPAPESRSGEGAGKAAPADGEKPAPEAESGKTAEPAGETSGAGEGERAAADPASDSAEAAGKESAGDRTEPAGDKSEGDKPADGVQDFQIGNQTVRVEYVKHLADGSTEVKLLDQMGVYKSGSKIRLYDKADFPNGKRTEYGDANVIAELPDGTSIYSLTNGNGVYVFPEAKRMVYQGDPFYSKQVERLPDKTEIWHTIDGGKVEWYQDDYLPKTAFGDVFRIDSMGKTRRYYTDSEDGKVFDVVQGGPRLKVIEYNGDEVANQLEADSFKEDFPQKSNLTRWGEVSDRTILPEGLEMTLTNGRTAFEYADPMTLPDGRPIKDGIKYNNDEVTFVLKDGTRFSQKNLEKLAPYEWRAREWDRPDGAEVYHFLDGQKDVHNADGTTYEYYPDGHQTSLGAFNEVIRTMDKNIYKAADGSRIEVPRQGGAPIVKYDAEGRPQELIQGKGITEVLKNGKESTFGVAQTVEFNTDGSSVFHLDPQYSQDLASVTILGSERFGIAGYALERNGYYLPFIGGKFEGPELDAAGLQHLLNTGQR